MMNQWNLMTYLECARDRQAAMEREIKRQHLLRELADATERVALFRKTVLFTGDLLVAAGQWLKQRAMTTQGHDHRPTMAGRFS